MEVLLIVVGNAIFLGAIFLGWKFFMSSSPERDMRHRIIKAKIRLFAEDYLEARIDVKQKRENTFSEWLRREQNDGLTTRQVEKALVELTPNLDEKEVSRVRSVVKDVLGR